MARTQLSKHFTPKCILREIASFQAHTQALFDTIHRNVHAPNSKDTLKHLKIILESCQKSWESINTYCLLNTPNNGVNLKDDFLAHSDRTNEIAQSIRDLPRICSAIELQDCIKDSQTVSHVRCESEKTPQSYQMHVERLLKFASDLDDNSQELYARYTEHMHSFTNDEDLSHFLTQQQDLYQSAFFRMIQACNQSTSASLHLPISQYIGSEFNDLTVAQDATKQSGYLIQKNNIAPAVVHVHQNIPMAILEHTDSTRTIATFEEHLCVNLYRHNHQFSSAKGLINRINAHQPDFEHLAKSLADNFGCISYDLNACFKEMNKLIEKKTFQECFLYKIIYLLQNLLARIPLLRECVKHEGRWHIEDQKNVMMRCSLFAIKTNCYKDRIPTIR